LIVMLMPHLTLSTTQLCAKGYRKAQYPAVRVVVARFAAFAKWQKADFR
jgi:hypothetical protein